jgi:Na+/H+-translocating membrane pyrophosphatase
VSKGKGRREGTFRSISAQSFRNLFLASSLLPHDADASDAASVIGYVEVEFTIVVECCFVLCSDAAGFAERGAGVDLLRAGADAVGGVEAGILDDDPVNLVVSADRQPFGNV